MIPRLSIGILLLVFAAVQFNDPDPWLWILAYGVVGSLTIASVWKSWSTIWINILTIIFAVTAAWYVPKIMQWVNEGMPSIVGEMKATSPHIEWMREFLGLVLCMSVLLWLRKSKYTPKGIT